MNPLRFKLKVPDETAALVRSLHPNLKRKIKAALQTVLTEPQTGKALKNELEGLRSFRVGKLRVVYRIKERIIEIVAIGPRKTIYEETLRAFKRREISRPSANRKALGIPQRHLPCAGLKAASELKHFALMPQ